MNKYVIMVFVLSTCITIPVAYVLYAFLRSIGTPLLVSVPICFTSGIPIGFFAGKIAAWIENRNT